MRERGAKRRGRRGAADHLRKYQWPKGVSGNPAGRKPRPSLESLVQSVLDELIDPEKHPGVTKRHVVARIMANEMMGRSARAQTERRLYLEREWPAIRHHRLAADLPPEYPDLSELTELELRFTSKILRKARESNEIEAAEESEAGDDD